MIFLQKAIDDFFISHKTGEETLCVNILLFFNEPFLSKDPPGVTDPTRGWARPLHK